MPLTVGSLFSGCGGLELGLSMAGIGPVRWQCEIDPFCRSILERHWPEVRRFENVETVRVADLEPVGLVVGGFPCQDISGAGKGRGLAGSRSGLWFEFARIVEGVRPQWVVVENVASGAKRWVDAVRDHLGRLGYETIPIPLSAEDIGAPHLRRRIFIVARSLGYADGDRSKGGLSKPDKGGRSLAAEVRALYPTPTAPEYGTSGNGDPGDGRGAYAHKGTLSLASLARRWPTVVVTDMASSGRATSLGKPGNTMHPGTSLTDAMRSWFSLLAPGTLRGGAAILTGAVLNPDFCRALMGFPENWLDSK